jgi:glycine/D-amino acid oxidase-like deaminating enzyme
MMCHGQRLDTAGAYCYSLLSMKTVAMIGAGISGLAAAHLLSRRHRGLFQLLLVKSGARRVLFNEPWSEPATRPHAAGASDSAA